MTVSSDDARSGPYNGNASTTVFAYDFKILDQAHLVVTLTSSAGVESVKTLTTHYTVSGVGGASGGNVTMVTAPASGEKLTITRSVPLTQLIDLQNRGGTQPSVLESAYDKLTQIVQDFNELYARVPRFPVSSAETSVELPLTLTADAVLKVNAAGDGFENGPTTTQISDAETQATAAAASAVAAAASETAAGVSETNAAASAVTASSYASPVTDLFTAGVDFTAGSSTTITLSGSGLSEDAVMITFDGVVQHHDTYSISGTTVTFTSTIPVGVLAIEASYGTRSTGAIDNVAIGANTPSTGAFTTINGVTPATAQYTTTLNTKLNNIEALADVTDATNVTAAGALMDSELTSIASVKALNQGLATTDSPSFVNVTSNLTGDITGNAATVTTNANLTGDVTSVGNATTIGATKVVESMLSAAVQTKLNNTAPSKFDATAAPTANSDSANTDTNGTFAVGSVWIDVTGNEAYRCVDDTPTAAIWISTTLTTSELGTMATQNANAVAITGGAISGATLDGVLGSNTPAAASVTTLTASGDVAINTDTLLVDVSTETIGVKMTPDVLGAPLQIKHDGTVAYLGLDGGNSDTAPFLSTWQDPDPASALFGWSFFNRSTDGNLRLSRRNNSTTDTEVLTIARSDGAATFAGTLSAGATDVTTLTASSEVFANSATNTGADGLVGFHTQDATAPGITMHNTGASGIHWGMYADASGNLQLRNNDTDTNVVTVGSSGTLSAGATTVTTLTASGNAAINTTLPTINTVDGALLVGSQGSIMCFSNEVDVGHNFYYNSGWKYRTTATASLLTMGNSGVPFLFLYTASGTADTAITWSEAGRIDASGNWNFQAKSLTTTGTLSAGATTVTTLTASGFVTTNTGMTINENGNASDFRVESAASAFGLYMNGTTGAVSVAGTLSAGLITVNAANKTNADEVGTITLASTDAYAIDKGGSIGFKGLYSSGGGVAIFGRIYGAKETAADGNFQGYLGFAVASGGSPAEKMRLNSDGTLDIAAGVYIGGTAAANLLDDYEEGTWTPVISGDGTAGTYTNGTTQATYTKIGRMVTVNFGIGSFSTATGGTGNLRITGLPFTKTAGQSPTGSVWFSSVNTGASVISLALVFSTAAGASATLNVNEVVDNAVVQLTPISGVGVSSQIHGSITYFV
jgi:hypothetical protein